MSGPPSPPPGGAGDGWPRAAATGVGSLPGTDVEDAVRLVFDELPDLPHLPELPARGPGAELTGRALAVAAELPADLQPSGWRLTDRPGLDARRAGELLARDLDALAAFGAGYAGTVKTQVGGPWTLAATVERPRGGAALGDPGAVRDLVQALAEGVAAHVGELRRRLPHARLVVQLDEPALPATLAGALPSASGFARLPAVGEAEATAGLGAVLAAAAGAGATPAVHCCAAGPPLGLLATAGARAVAVDAATLSPRDDDALGELVEAGVHLLVGVVPALGPGAAPTPRECAAAPRALWRRLGFDPGRLADSVTVTPACGLAGASVGWARTALRICRKVAALLDEAPERR